MSDDSLIDEALASLTDEEQVALLTRTENGPRSEYDAAETLALSQDPSVIYESD